MKWLIYEFGVQRTMGLWLKFQKAWRKWLLSRRDSKTANDRQRVRVNGNHYTDTFPKVL